MKPWPPLPELTVLTREQLIDMAHRLNTTIVEMTKLVDMLERRLSQLERAVSAREPSVEPGGKT